MKVIKYLIKPMLLLLCCMHFQVSAESSCPDKKSSLEIEQMIYSPSQAIDKAKAIELFDQYKSCLQKEEVDVQTKKFAGINWGVGLAFLGINGQSIDEAKLIDNVVRITKEHSKSAALMLETHYFMQDKDKWGANIGHGPFATIRLAGSEGEKIGAFGLGWMIGFKDGPVDGGSWNVGFGFFVDTEVQELGSGISEGQALPGSETAIRFKEVDKSGWVIMLSSTF